MGHMLKKCHLIGLTPSEKRSDLTRLIACDPVTENCILRKCKSCKNKTIPFSSDPTDETEIIYPQRVSKTKDRISSKTKKNMKVKVTIKENVKSTVKSLKNDFQAAFESYSIAHCHRIEKQTTTFVVI